jgi:hypothetical protein
MIMRSGSPFTPMQGFEQAVSSCSRGARSARNNMEAIKQATLCTALLVGRQNHGAVQLIAARDHLEEQIGIACVIGQVSDLVDER